MWACKNGHRAKETKMMTVMNCTVDIIVFKLNVIRKVIKLCGHINCFQSSDGHYIFKNSICRNVYIISSCM